MFLKTCHFWKQLMLLERAENSIVNQLSYDKIKKSAGGSRGEGGFWEFHLYLTMWLTVASSLLKKNKFPDVILSLTFPIEQSEKTHGTILSSNQIKPWIDNSSLFSFRAFQNLDKEFLVYWYIVRCCYLNLWKSSLIILLLREIKWHQFLQCS